MISFEFMSLAIILSMAVLPTTKSIGKGRVKYVDGKPGDEIGSECINPRDGAEMVWVPAGEFIMGSSVDDIDDVLKKVPSASTESLKDEMPQRTVYLDGFWMYKNKVTVGQYRKFCKDTKRSMILTPDWASEDNDPIQYITWEDASDYARWAGVSLPTEAQWEKAVRGTDGRVFPWGSTWPAPGPEDSPSCASPYGCIGIVSKVLEWCSDWYDSNYYLNAPNKNPIGPLVPGGPDVTPGVALSGTHVYRGSSWRMEYDTSRCAHRRSYLRTHGPCYVGFRCAAKINRLTGYTFIFNQDAMDVDAMAPPGKGQEWQRDWYRRAFAAGAQIFIPQVAAPDVVQTKDTPTGEIWGERFGVEQEDIVVGQDSSGGPFIRRRWYETIAELTAQGTDELHLACEEGRKAGVIILAGMRMSDAHQGGKWKATSDAPNMSLFMMAHPEWCNTWKDGTIDATLNYAIPEVQAHRLQILRELATNYDIDGVELDWMRWCRNFPEGHQRDHLNDLTEFVADVRKMLDDVSKKKGVARMILGQRVPSTVEECLNIGCDVPTWIRNGYADYVSPMDFLMNDLNIRTDEFVEISKGTECLVYPSFGGTRYSFGNWYLPRKNERRRAMTSTYNQFRATAANWFAWGAAGGSCYNFYLWTPDQQDYYSKAIEILSDPVKAFAGPRHYVYLPVWKDHADGVGPTGRFNAQSLTFNPDTIGKRQVFTFRMADGRNGETLEGILRLHLYDATPEDKFTVDLNGKKIPDDNFVITYLPEGETGVLSNALPGDGTFDWPSNLRFEISLNLCPAFKGDNELGITLVKKNPSGTQNMVMEALEVNVFSSGLNR